MAIFFLKKEILVKKAENENPELEKREKAKKYEIIESIGKMREKINKESSLTWKSGHKIVILFYSLRFIQTLTFPVTSLAK